MKINEKDLKKVQDYLIENKDKSIQQVFDEIKSKKLKNRSKEEHLVFTYLYMNKRKLRLK